MTRLVFAHTAALLACGMALALAKNDGGGGKSDPPAPAPRPDLPQFKCHKIVGAAKIVSIDRGEGDDPDVLIVGVASDDVTFPIPKGWHPEAETGGYLVQYEDGYISYSPAAPFEAGYAPLDGSADGIAPGSDIPDGAPFAKVEDAIARIEQLRAEGKLDAADYPSLGQILRAQADLFDPQTGGTGETTDHFATLRAGLIDVLGMIPEKAADASGDDLVQVALQQLSLKAGYQSSLEAAVKEIEDLREKLRVAQNGGHRRRVLRTYGNG